MTGVPKPPPNTDWIETVEVREGERPKRNGATLSTPRWRRLMFIVLSMVLLSGLNLGYTAYVDHRREQQVQRLDRERDQTERKADQRLCALFTILDQGNSSAPPTSEFGRLVAGAIHEALVSLDCPR